MASSLIPVQGNRIILIRNVPTVEATPDYASGDLIGGKQELLNAVEREGMGGIIRGVTLRNAELAAGANVDALFFNADPSGTTFTENSALAPADADLQKLVAACSISTHFALSGGSFSTAGALRLPFVIPSGTTLYCALVARAAMNQGAADDLKLEVVIERL